VIAGPEKLLLSEEVAALVGMAPSTLAEHCRRGRFPCRRLPGTRRYLFPAADVQAYLDGCELEVKLLGNGGVIVKPRRRR
jgi:predicted DNA-binding transcriptional regulator AlpA